MREKDDVKRVFSKNKEAYVTSSTHAFGKDLSLMINWLQPKSTMKVLDIATGGGHVAKHLANHVKQVVATDITEDMLENTALYLESHNNINYAVADAEDLPFEGENFDIVSCRIAAHHFPNPERFIAEVNRVLKPGGQFLLIDNIAPEAQKFDQFINSLEKMRDHSHVRSRSLIEWKKLFDDRNLSIIKEQTRKKVLPYHEWVQRTLDNDEIIQHIGQLILESDKETKSYFQVDSEEDTIHSFAIDEWMVMCAKRPD
ncbi:class I SAM-dependent methyltransferase [Virgibacillus litoralis]|uniref:Ubiquinone/menaquinone biosynthesis C-methylase UbiE n=1 Tax=Virgibacillus litoralis TaxID=578221 RepID=A0ABS4HIH5_9BACI|nr:class I SAM-dependent methyltransferase [Virgibacillus litoralis]MBP1950725.1 ubiquinone/menaquinone biosynthesis C-methylase UbiE [Virgibacillus litoralis]